MRLQALGCNTVSFYVPWNVHEPRPGVYSWKGFADVEGYLRLVQELGMNVLLRLGPYICAGKAPPGVQCSTFKAHEMSGLHTH